MPCLADLKKIGLSDYLEQLARLEDPFWFFQHIPKTAGSSISAELTRHMPPYRNLHIDYSRKDVTALSQMREVITNFLAEDGMSHIRSASGHVLWPDVARMAKARPRTQIVTFLRNPVQRVVSDYRYQRTPLHPPHKEFAAEFPTLESYVAGPRSRNSMTRYLMGTVEGVTEEDLIAHVERNFAFVGLVEMYPFSLNTMFACMGVPDVMPKEHKRKTPDTADTKVDLTPQLMAEIRRTNQLDVAIFQHVVEMMRALRPEWVQMRGLKPRSGEVE